MGALEVKEHIARNEEQARALCEHMRCESSKEQFCQMIERYVKLRFLIEDEPCASDRIADLAALSIRRTLERTGDSVKLEDLGVNCAGASSALTKHLLLIISLRKGLRVDLDPETAALAETLPDLAEVLWAALHEEAAVHEES